MGRFRSGTPEYTIALLISVIVILFSISIFSTQPLQAVIALQTYKKILVAMDCSPVDDAIIEHVSAPALQNSAQVYLIHVVHSHTLDQHRALHETAETSLNSTCDMLKARGIETRIVIRSGEPDSEILKEIDNDDFDLVAMATHGHTFIGDLLFGSVSDTLKHKISIPLLLLGPQPTISKTLPDT
jgi:nucleotide-binding universal stress UspA family protein